MNTIKTLKSYALYTLLAVCGFAIWYLGTAFVVLDLNIANWGEITRLLVVLFGVLTSSSFVAFAVINRS